jgi:large subunit ribosomal protein L10
MTKLGLIIKQEAERIVKDKLRNTDSFLLVKYSNISASDLNLLRNSLSGVGSYLMIIKNSVSKRVLKTYQDLISLIDGPCGLIFVNKDLISTSRIVYKFTKQNPNLKIRAGLLKDRILTQEEIEVLSKIPSLSALQGKVVGALKSPIFDFVFSLKQILNKLVWALVQIKDKKG